MQRTIAQGLKATALQAGKNFSIPDREHNHNKETFQLEKLIPLSESTACGIYLKSSKKKAVLFFYYINTGGGKWLYFVPTYDHIIGMERVKAYLSAVEEYNFKYNFDELN